MRLEPLSEKISEQTGRASTQIVLTLVGGVMLLASLAALYLFEGGSAAPCCGRLAAGC